MNSDNINLEEKKKTLTKEEYEITQNKGTEKPFTGKYCDFMEQGIYNCKICNEPLFTSEDKFESSCGWPAFSAESFKGTINYIEDITYNMKRIEVTCSKCGCHLGHVFDDGPKKKGGKRYCVNSASIDFQPK
jgi:peptide-methionine (R)-S-oxide reductase